MEECRREIGTDPYTALREEFDLDRLGAGETARRFMMRLEQIRAEIGPESALRALNGDVSRDQIEALTKRAKMVRIEDEAARRGFKLRRQGHELVGPCPKCREGDDRFFINIEKQVFNVRKCCDTGGDNIDTVKWLDDCGHMQAVETGRILPVTQTNALKCAELHVPNRRPENDELIAATALVHDLAVVTNNVRHFCDTGVDIICPWYDESSDKNDAAHRPDDARQHAQPWPALARRNVPSLQLPHRPYVCCFGSKKASYIMVKKINPCRRSKT
jgi:hypothetical protein